jgi:hypothetical protein
MPLSLGFETQQKEVKMGIRGRFDGQGIVLEQPSPADWRPNMAVLVTPCAAENEVEDGPSEAMLKLAARARDSGLPPDFSEQHDHYIHGTPKR